MNLDVRLFARARDVVGSERVEMELPKECRVGDLRHALAQRFPELAPLVPSLLIAVGNDYADDSRQLTPDAQVACFPPVSGG